MTQSIWVNKELGSPQLHRLKELVLTVKYLAIAPSCLEKKYKRAD